MKKALLFPGQGSQSIGMLNHYDSEIIARIFSKGSEIVGEDLLKLTQTDNDKINQTIYTQPIMLLAGFAVYTILKTKKRSLSIDYLAGHSLGEITAALAGEVFCLEDAVKIVQKRSQLMQEAVPHGEGAMAAILGLDDEQVKNICKEMNSEGVIEPVNFNSPGQVVVAGEKKIIECSLPLFKEKGAKRALLLPVSVPSHCSLMFNAEKLFKDFLEKIEFKDSVIPIVQNVCAKPVTNHLEIKSNLISQLSNPVLWTSTIDFLWGDQVSMFVECGPGKVLTGLNKRIIKSDSSTNLALVSDESFNEF